VIWQAYTNSIKIRLITNVILIHAVLMGLVVFDMLQREEEFIQKELLSKGSDLTTILAANTANALLNNDLVALGELISQMKQLQNHYMVFILDEDGRVRASQPPTYFNQVLNDAHSLTLMEDLSTSDARIIQNAHTGFVDTMVKITVDGRTIGYARTLLDARSLTKELELITTKGLLYIALAIIIGALFAWLSVKTMTRNLNRLTTAARELGRHRFDVALPEIKGNDEIAAMGNAFRVMQTSLHEYLAALRSKEERLSLALEGSSDGLWDWDIHTKRIYFSPRYQEMLGYPPESVTTTFEVWSEKLHPKEREQLINKIRLFMQSTDIHYEAHFNIRSASGAYLSVLARGKKVRDEQGDTVRLIGTLVDMSQIDAMQTLLQNVIDGVEIPLMVIDREYNVTLMNQAVKEQRFEHFVADMHHPKCYEISHGRYEPCDSDEHPCPLHDAMVTAKSTKTVHIHRTRDGSRQVVEISAHPVFDAHGNFEAIIETAYDITSLIDAQDSLRHQAEHDILTGLPNRVLFLDRLQLAIKQARRHDEKVAVLFLDLDHFKEINDSLGHDAGDELLRHVAALLQQSVRSSDTVARIGGDEFTLIIDKIKNSDIVIDVISKIMNNLARPFQIKGREYYSSCSIGAAIYPDDGDEANLLLKYADAAMYRAKSEGRHTYQFYTSDMTEKALERILLESSLRQALQQNELTLFYQPQIDSNDETMIGMETLIRWNHPKLGLVSPDYFIPLAEETGLIVTIDRWVLREGMRQMRRWHDAGKNPPRLSINLSMLQLGNEHFASELADMLQESGCDASWIELELTESQIMKDPESAISQLRQITQLGIGLSIDDFGTGYSSLAYLKRFPIQKLKIDRSFINELPEDSDDQEIVRTIIAMALNLRLEVIAEGVETKAQCDFLRQNGCHLIQGYYYFRPMPHAEIEALLYGPPSQ